MSDGELVRFVNDDKAAGVFAGFDKRSDATVHAVRAGKGNDLADVAQKLHFRCSVNIEHIGGVRVFLHVPL